MHLRERSGCHNPPRLAAVGGPAMVAVVQRGLAACPCQGAVPGHRLPSSCQPARPVPSPVPAASLPAPQGPPCPPALSQLPLGTPTVCCSPGATVCPQNIPIACLSGPQGRFVAKTPRLGGDSAGGGPVPITAAALDPSPRVSRQRGAPAQRHPTAVPGSAGSNPAQSPFQPPWHPAPARGGVPAFISPSRCGPTDPPNSLHV